MVRHVIFDFDGTIVDSRYMVVDLINLLAPKYNLRQIKEQHYEHLRSLTVAERCRFVGLPLYKLPLFKLDINKAYKKASENLAPVPGLKDVLARIKEKGVNLSIISSNSASNIKHFLGRNNIDCFDSIYSSSGLFGKDKTIAGFLRKHKLKNQEVIYVGDEHRDIEACRKNHVKVIAVTWGYDDRELLAAGNPDFIVDEPAELFEIVAQNISTN